MKCLVSNNIIYYAQDDLVLDAEKLSGDRWMDFNFNASNSEIVDIADLPNRCIGGAYQYADGVVSVHNQTIIDNYLASQIQKVDSISMRQARLQLLTMNLLDDVNAQISTLSQSAQVEWEYATEVQRDNPLVAQLQSSLAMTDNDMNQFFYEAVQL
ncbi:MAG: hypothetical protein WBI40_09275 [Methylococcaceae bacterium]